MAYQNVGTPKFYIDYLNYSRAIDVGGIVTGTGDFPDNLNSLIGLNPTQIIRATTTGDTPGSIDFELYDGVENVFDGEKVWCGIFGHNFGDSEDCWWAVGAGLEAGNWGWFHGLNPIVNTRTAFRTGTDYNGWSLFNCNAILTGKVRLSFYNSFSVDWDVKLGGFAIGKEYTMPNAPNLSLTMSREYGGTKEFTTHNGSSMSNTMWSKPPKWGSLGAWELGDGNPKLSRSGRRSWDLKFSYMADSDVFGSNQSLSNLHPSAEDYRPIYNSTGYEDSDIHFTESGLSHLGFNYNILTDDSFFSQVWHKTLGGTLPFIFQPDSSNNNPDQFCIARFKDNSLKATQSAFNVYDISLSIEEVW